MTCSLEFRNSMIEDIRPGDCDRRRRSWVMRAQRKGEPRPRTPKEPDRAFKPANLTISPPIQ
jgi:hypothetical protein